MKLLVTGGAGDRNLLREIEERVARAFEDAFVETAREADAPGARLTGGGFGDCAIALVAADESDTLANYALRGERLR